MKQKGRDYSSLIIWTSAFVGMIRYAAAFLSSDLGMITGLLSEIVTWLLGISGFFMGVLGTLGTAYIFDGWRQKMPATGQKWNNKFVALTVFVALAFIAEILILVPFTMSRVLHVSVAVVLHGGVWWWSTAVVVMPLLLIGGVSVSNQIVSVSGPETYRKVTDREPEKEEKHTSDWRKIRPRLTDDQVRNIAIGETKNIAFNFKIDDRTARNWRKYAGKELESLKK